jgi:4a-hydroxytetrahydrobiopterin dehydratase
MSSPLTASELTQALAGLQDWTHEDDRLNRELAFPGFRQAMAFIQRIAFEAEELNHHPEIYCFHNRVALALTSADAEFKVTKRDVLLAHKIDQVLEEFVMEDGEEEADGAEQ